MIIPFFIPHAGCPHRCVFCDQKRITGRDRAVDPLSIPTTIRSYLETNTRTGSQGSPLTLPLPNRERSGIGEQKLPGRRPDVQVAFYGGSFTALEQSLQHAYLREVRPFLESGQVQGIRISTRPDCITPGVLALLREYQVTIVELGVQSLNDDVLRSSGRGHTSEHTIAATQQLRAAGFSVGYQLMPGLPEDSRSRFRETVSGTVALKPDIVRIYPAVVIKDTALEQLFRSGRYAPLTLDEAVDWCAEAQDRFEEAGIKVIRTGLQSTDSLSGPDTIAAGPYHPAFGQLVASARFLERMLNALGRTGKDARAVLCVNPLDLSTALGQKKRNLDLLKSRTGSPAITVKSAPHVPPGTVEVDGACVDPCFGI